MQCVELHVEIQHTEMQYVKIHQVEIEHVGNTLRLVLSNLTRALTGT